MLKGLDISFQDLISGYYLPALLNILLERIHSFCKHKNKGTWRGFSLGLTKKEG